MTLLWVISGGQCGVDVAALRAAKSCGLRTGGMMPRGFRTLYQKSKRCLGYNHQICGRISHEMRWTRSE